MVFWLKLANLQRSAFSHWMDYVIIYYLTKLKLTLLTQVLVTRTGGPQLTQNPRDHRQLITKKQIFSGIAFDETQKLNPDIKYGVTQHFCEKTFSKHRTLTKFSLLSYNS